MYKHSNSIKKYNLILISILLSTSLLLSGCIDEKPVEPSAYFYSFEEGMNEWETDGTDLSAPPINWSINQSDDRATDGNNSLKFYLDNMNDAGKIWIEKQFELEANTQYEITITYDFATSDFGSFNLFNIITGASLTNPEVAEHLTFQDDTGHHQDEDIGYKWLNKTYTLTIQTNDSKNIFISIGIWGNWETARTYYFDAINISFDKISLDDIPDISGSWKISYYDFMGNVTNTENVSITQDETQINVKNDSETIFTGIILKNSLATSDDKSDFIITDCDFRGLGIDYIYIYNESMMETNLPLCENCRPAVFTKNG